ncbi:NAD(P)H-quinone oxidoreductase [Azospirillum sp. TSA6c]|uniref:NAD(P)H-quinone oxidoreductase n=1 Tax=unclassified Azospirillum TaxID=2630922 RepID=UPI000D621F4E|nr:NAD(P)H-quinone oxidoreductase [Azospirillum sp. TSA6c]PWC47295.1 quinone oxidoreductase [Azospirillum sp. TSA6c]
MRAAVFQDFGGADVLRLAEVPAPEIRPTDLLVRVRAAGVNRADLLQRQGAYGTESYGDSPLLGLELAGEVVEVGGAVTGFRRGDLVMAITGGGAYAEVARVDQALAVRMPEHLGFIEAAAVMESFVTAYEVVGHLAGLGTGQTVLVHAAAGGVGSAMVQVARALGGRVLATAGAGRLGDVLSLGAEAVVDYRSGDFEAEARWFTAGRGLDAVVDFIGGGTLAGNLRSLRPGGILVQVGLMGGGGDAPIPLGLLLHNHLRLVGTVMKSRQPNEKRAMVQRFADRMLPLVASGTLRAVVSQVFPLADVVQAHEAMERGGGFGKIVLTLP